MKIYGHKFWLAIDVLERGWNRPLICEFLHHRCDLTWLGNGETHFPTEAWLPETVLAAERTETVRRRIIELWVIRQLSGRGRRSRRAVQKAKIRLPESNGTHGWRPPVPAAVRDILKQDYRSSDQVFRADGQLWPHYRQARGCAWCGWPFLDHGPFLKTREHVVPRALNLNRSGPPSPLTAAHKQCNGRRGLDTDWLPYTTDQPLPEGQTRQVDRLDAIFASRQPG